MSKKKSKKSAQKTPEKENTEIDFTKVKNFVLDHYIEIIYVLLVSVVVINQFIIFSAFKQVDGPIYGGDIYNHYGRVLSIYDGDNPFTAANIPDAYEHYPWLTHFMAAAFAWLTGLGIFKVFNVYFPILVTIASAILFYYIGRKLFDNRWIGVILGFYWITLVYPKTFSYHVSVLVFTGLTLYMLYWAIYLRNDWKSKILAGVVLGLSALQYPVQFIGGYLFAGFAFLYNLFERHISLKAAKLSLRPSGFGQSIVAELKKIAPILLIGFLVSMLYLYPLLFVYHYDNVNAAEDYQAGLTDSYTIGWVINSYNFFDFSGLASIVVSLFILLGIYFAFKIKNKDAKRFTFLVFLTGLAAVSHHLITTPLLGFSIYQHRMKILLVVLKGLLFAIGVFGLSRLVAQYKKEYVRYFYIAVIFVLMLNFTAGRENYLDNKWTQTGLSESSFFNSYMQFSDEIRQMTPADETFIALHGETGHAFNGLTGRKLLYTRKTHTSHFIDMDKRAADQAIILFGNNTEKAKELLREYNIRYMVEDVYALSEMQKCMQNWEKLQDPAFGDATYSCFRVDGDKYADYLAENGVRFFETKARWDVSSNIAPQLPVLVVYPEYNSFIQNNTKVVKVKTDGNNLVARLLQIG